MSRRESSPVNLHHVSVDERHLMIKALSQSDRAFFVLRAGLAHAKQIRKKSSEQSG